MFLSTENQDSFKDFSIRTCTGLDWDKVKPKSNLLKPPKFQDMMPRIVATLQLRQHQCQTRTQETTFPITHSSAQTSVSLTFSPPCHLFLTLQFAIPPVSSATPPQLIHALYLGTHYAHTFTGLQQISLS